MRQCGKTCYFRAGQATDDNVTWCILFACWITKATDMKASVVYWLAYWPLEPDFAGSNPAEAVSGVWKILSMPSFGGEVK